MIEHILTERRGDVLAITLNRSDRLNVAPPGMFEEISATLADLQGARAVLLEGADVPMAAGRQDPGEATHAALTGNYNSALLTIAALDVPVVSAVRGPAVGIGCSLARAAD